MPTTGRKADLVKILQDPAAAFRAPADVLDHPELTDDQRLAILEQWERDARGLSVAEEEGMAGGEESSLARVKRAIAALGQRRSAKGPGTKYG